MDLIDRCPRIGKAWYAERFAHLDGKRVSEILGHDLTTGVCTTCGGKTRRHTIRDRVIVGPNRGLHGVFHSERCRGCGISHGSNYSPPPWIRA